MELLEDLLIKVGWDSFQAKEIRIDTNGLMEMAISHGIYIMFFKQWFVRQIGGMTGLDSYLEMAIIDTLGKSAIDVGVDMVRGRQAALQNAIMRNATSELIALAYDMIVKKKN